jgi:2-methylcitrate dehydratase
MNSGLIAAAEAAGAGGQALVSALVLAYDVYCSFCDAVDFNSRGGDQPVYSILGCVLGAGRLLGLPREQLGHAVSLAVAPNMALAQSRRGQLSSWKGCAGANASRNALFAAALARDGFTGPSAVFEGDGGLFEATGGAFEWPLPEGRHLITETHIKGLPVCYHGQSPVWAALELREAIDPAKIETIEVHSYKTGVMMMGADESRWAPETRETADHSLPYCVSVALLDGEVVDASFAQARLRDPAIAALMRKVKVSEDPRLTSLYPEGSPGRVAVRMQSGETHTREIVYPRGHAKSPMAAADVERKFRDMAGPRLGAGRCEALLQAIRGIEHADVRRDIAAVLTVEE